jgi:adenylate cyclase
MPSRAGSLWDYATGAVDGPLAAAGENVRAAVDRWLDLFRDDAVDFDAEGLLDGADDREARIALLRQLYAAGVPLDELRSAVEQDRLALLPVEAVLKATGEHTVAEMAAESGLAEEVVARRIRALGISKPDSDTVVHDDALAAANALKELEESGIPEDGIDDICRIVGRSTERMADGIREVVGSAFIETGDTERDVGLRYAAAARRMIPVFSPLIEFTMTMQLLKLVRSDVISRTERAAGTLPTGRDITVAFVDLTDFTGLSEQLRPEELGDLVRRFEALVQEKTPPSAQHVKTIGDAAMIVSSEPAAALQAATSLVHAADADDFPALHAGVAMGRAVTREGDWHGRPVNVASRLTDVAPPGQVFATEAVRQAVGDQLEWSDAGRQRLKGIDEPVTVFCLAPAAG